MEFYASDDLFVLGLLLENTQIIYKYKAVGMISYAINVS